MGLSIRMVRWARTWCGHSYIRSSRSIALRVFFFNDTATTEIYTLSLHDALPICRQGRKNHKYICNNSRNHIIVLKCISAREYLLPHLIVTKRAYYYSGNYIRGQGMPGSVYAHFSKIGRAHV